MALEPEYAERDKHRPVIVHCFGLLIRDTTHCSEDDALTSAWKIFDYLGQPELQDIKSFMLFGLTHTNAEAY